MDRAFYSGTDVRRGAGQKVQLVQLKRQNRRVSMFARRLCLGSPGGEMSRQVLLATLARPLCEPSHRPPQKKDRPKSLSFCSDNTVTDDEQAPPVHSWPPFLDLGLIAAVTARTYACPTPSGHKVRRIAADIRNGSIAPVCRCADHFRSYPVNRHGQHRSVCLKGAATSRHRATTLG
jgi:hypothetical protein